MSGRRHSPSELPYAPLELMHPLLLPGPDVPGAEMVGELGDCNSATLLEILRAVLAWSAHPEHSPALDRAALERTEYALLLRGPDAFASPAGLLAGYMANPETACPREVAWACVCISDWASARGARDVAAVRAGSRPRLAAARALRLARRAAAARAEPPARGGGLVPPRPPRGDLDRRLGGAGKHTRRTWKPQLRQRQLRSCRCSSLTSTTRVASLQTRGTGSGDAS